MLLLGNPQAMRNRVRCTAVLIEAIEGISYSPDIRVAYAVPTSLPIIFARARTAFFF